MRPHVTMVKGTSKKGDYAFSVSLLDEASWCPVVDCREDDLVCPIPSGHGALESLESCKTTDGDFCSVNMPLADFSGEMLSGAKFSGAELSCSSFRKASLQKANFSQCELCSADLSYSDLREANFEGADLSFANLKYSDLRGAKLKDVRFAEVELKGAKFDRTTELPVSRDEAETLGMIYCF